MQVSLLTLTLGPVSLAMMVISEPASHLLAVGLGGQTIVFVLMVYFGAPSMFITLWFRFDYVTNPPLGTLII
jgi:hypothetical protein